MNESDQEPLKIMVVGDHTVGKSSLKMAYKKEPLPTGYDPCVFENLELVATVQGVSYNVSLLDIAGRHEEIRVHRYPNTDVFLLVYAVDNRSSFKNLTTKWIPELKHHCPTASIVLVGAKVDIRKEGTAKGSCVSYNEGLKLSKKIGTFIEVSAKTGENLELLFKEAARVAINNKLASNMNRNDQNPLKIPDISDHAVGKTSCPKVSKENGTFTEVSAKKGVNLEAVLDEAVRVAVNKSKKGLARGCTIV